MQAFAHVCESAARTGGRVLLDWFGRIKVNEKAPKDLVTEADVASQAAIRRVVLDAFPEHDFLGEEDTAKDDRVSTSRYRWIVDPLDGTTNYVHQFPGFSVSVALQCDDEVVVGVVLDPISGECFSASRGQGARLNGEPIAVSDTKILAEALVAASFSAGVQRDSDEIARFLSVLVECQALRRLGSAALNLAYLACGRLDAYWATSVQSWDVAAGLLLVEEAGGIVTGIEGAPLNIARPRFAAASTRTLHTELLACLASA